ncbi:MAG: S46 family peptidase [bacterium]|nr:S46 family peptidase [bacterium]
MKNVWILLLAISLSTYVKATEGMWLPLLLAQLNEQEMQSMGMKMTAEDIYSVNKGSLKDAIVHVGGFCTGEVISDQGLVLTNHHCGYGQIQSHSTLENNYLEDGFWAMNRKQEIPNPGLFVTFIVRIEDVTDLVLNNVTEDMDAKMRQSWVDKNTKEVTAAAKMEDYQEAMVRDFFEGTKYYMFVTETYRDIRLVGAPPSSIGKFGADTDNWVWPRHTGDFSLFRIYASPDNKPAEYSEENVPFKPRHHLPISLDGVEEDDFTLVFGFPGRTEEYLPAAAIEQRVDVVNPIRIGIRDRALNVVNTAMQADPGVRIKYASKQSRIANYWKKWIGENQGIKATDGVGRKKAYEAEFRERVMGNPEWREKYGSLLSSFERLYGDLEPYAATNTAVGEIAGRNIELFRLANTLHSVVKMYESSGAPMVESRMGRLEDFVEDFYKDYEPSVDQGVFATLMDYYFTEISDEHQAPFAVERYVEAGKDADKLASMIYLKSKLARPGVLELAMEEGPEALIKLIKNDVAYALARAISDYNDDNVAGKYRDIKAEIDDLQQQYMRAQIDVFTERRFYPDANGTLRVTYGKVDGYQPRDAVRYEPVTYLDGVMEKYVPGDYEFDVPQRLRKLYQKKDYGDYGEDGKMPVCFIGTNHTTGGNSGSPAIDAYGNLIGLNFDRAWEGTMSDLNYDASICRNIMVDARYILFVIDKFAGAGHLVEEMTLVHPKKG